MLNGNFELIKEKFNGKEMRGGEVAMRCPAHKDHTPSLHMKETEDGTILMNCKAGCKNDDILATIGLKTSDLFFKQEGYTGGAVSRKNEIKYNYRDAEGNHVFYKNRYYKDGKKEMYCSHLDNNGKEIRNVDGVNINVLYRLPEMLASSDAEVYFPEGEKDVETLRALGLTATTIGSGKWDDSYKEYFKGKTVIILADNDDAGITKANDKAKGLRAVAESIKMVMLPDMDEGGDVTDWMVMGHSKAELLEIIKETPAWNGRTWTGTDAEINLKVEIEFLEDCLARSDRGDAILLARLYTDKYVYDTRAKTWFKFGGVTWEMSREVERIISYELADQYRFAAEILSADGEKEKAEAFTKHATTLGSARAVSGVLKSAENEDGLKMDGNLWDNATNLLAVKNGVIDMDTLELREASPKEYLLTASPTEFKGIDLVDENIEQFLGSTFENEPEARDYLERIIGSALKGNGREHIFPIMVGEGRNGKDTLLNMVAWALGKGYAKDIQKSVVLGQQKLGSASPEIVELRGKRMVWFSETSADDELNSSLIKKLTGSKDISGRDLFSGIVQFRKTYTIFLMTNEMPKVKDDSEGFWDRVRVVPFNYRFVDMPVKANERNRDPKLESNLEKVPSAILAWLLRCVAKYNEKGLAEIPQSIKEATQAYRQDQNELYFFIEDRCEKGESLKVSASDLYQSYRNWAIGTGQKAILEQKIFGEKMGKLFPRKREKNGKFYIGIAVN